MSYKFTGVKELDRKFASLDRKYAKRTIRRAEKKTLKPILQEAKANAPVLTGEYQEGHKIRAGSRSRVTIDTEVQVKGVRHAPLAEFDKEYKSGRVVPGAHNIENAYDNHADSARDELIEFIWQEFEKMKI